MLTPREILNTHTQHYRDSCAASGMEMLLKLHGFEPAAFRVLQDRYGDTNIGFEKLADLLPYGIDAKDQEPTVGDGFSKIEEEARAGRFPLVSLPGPAKSHIWVAVIEGGKLRFLSRDFQNPSVIELDDDFGLRLKLIVHRLNKIHFAAYEIKTKTA
jgi:hypothetical protein